MTKKPIILIPSNIIDYNGLPGHVIRDTYVAALTQISGAQPLVLPVTGREAPRLLDLVGVIDGILLTGSPSNVDPVHYNEKRIFEDKWLDQARDAVTLQLIRDAVALDIPLIAVCRGFQEMNVALGGSLHQRVQEVPGFMDHRDNKNLTDKENYENPAHRVTTQKGGLFEQWGVPEEFAVNSIHQQGVKRLGSGLHAEAIAEDGLIEAISVPEKRFILGTQWHPEGDWHTNPVSRQIFERFGESVRKENQKNSASFLQIEVA